MRRPLIALLTAALAVSMLAFTPSSTEGGTTTDESTTTETPTLITPAPVDDTLYFHGADERYVDENEWLDGLPPMDRTEPTGSEFESKQLLNYAVGPNSACAGNGLWPVWVGFVGEGTIVDDATVTFDVVGAIPGNVTVNVWADVSGTSCNDAYPEPDATATVALPVGAGTVEVTLPTAGLSPDFQLMVQLQPASDGPAGLFHPTNQGRVLYDSADYLSSISFTCQPDDVETEEEATAADCDPLN